MSFAFWPLLLWVEFETLLLLVTRCVLCRRLDDISHNRSHQRDLRIMHSDRLQSINVQGKHKSWEKQLNVKLVFTKHTGGCPDSTLNSIVVKYYWMFSSNDFPVLFFRCTEEGGAQLRHIYISRDECDKGVAGGRVGGKTKTKTGTTQKQWQ